MCGTVLPSGGVRANCRTSGSIDAAAISIHLLGQQVVVAPCRQKLRMSQDDRYHRGPVFVDLGPAVYFLWPCR